MIAKPTPVEAPIVIMTPATAEAEPSAAKRERRRNRRRNEAALPVWRAGERWKRRLPPALW